MHWTLVNFCLSAQSGNIKVKTSILEIKYWVVQCVLDLQTRIPNLYSHLIILIKTSSNQPLNVTMVAYKLILKAIL